MLTHTVIDSTLGDLTLVADDAALVGLYLPEHKGRPDDAELGDRVETGFEAATAQLGEYFAERRTEFDLELAPVGDPFQLRVWALLAAIPYGQTRSYGDLARELGDGALARAVGSANARNPLSIVVPCHRVVAADGALTGYAGGLERKRALLELENPARPAEQPLF